METAHTGSQGARNIVCVAIYVCGNTSTLATHSPAYYTIIIIIFYCMFALCVWLRARYCLYTDHNTTTWDFIFSMTAVVLQESRKLLQTQLSQLPSLATGWLTEPANIDIIT